MFSGRDNNETQPLTFLASSVATGAWKSGVTSHMPAATGTRSSVEGAGRTTAVQHVLWKQAGCLRYSHSFGGTKPLCNSIAAGSSLTSRAQVWKRWDNLRHLRGEGGSTRQVKPTESQALALLSVPSSQYQAGAREGLCG